MKKLSLLLSLLVILITSTFANGPTITKIGWCGGVYTVSVTNIPGGATCHLIIGTYDSTFISPSSNFIVSIPQPLQGTTVSFTIGFINGGGKLVSTDGTTSTNGTGTCSQLPVKLINFAAHKNGDYSTSVSWATTFEANNNYFLLEGSNDGTNFHTEVLLFSKYSDGNSQVSTDYAFKIGATTQSKLILAGFGTLAGILLFGILIGTMKRKKALWLMPVMLLIFTGSLVSCQKHVDTPTDKSSVKWKYLRLKQADKDGTIVIASSTLIINN